MSIKISFHLIDNSGRGNGWRRGRWDTAKVKKELGVDQLLQTRISARGKIFGWILVLAGTFFAFVYVAMPGSFFPGVTIKSFSEKFGLYSTGVRILGAVLGQVVALVLNSAALLALMLMMRIFIELGDVVVGLILNGGPDTNTIALTALAAIKTFMLVHLMGVIRAAAVVGRKAP
jgi:hypothetical protein